MKQKYQGAPANGLGAAIPRKLFGLGRTSALLLALGLSLGARAQTAPSFFRADAEAKTAAAGTPLAAALFHSQALTLDVAGLRSALATAPAESRPDAAPLVLALPRPDGTTQRFALHEAPVMAPALAARFPSIKTYAGVGLDDKSASVRLDLSPQGFHAQVLTANGKSFYIDPVSRTDDRHYLGFFRADMNRAAAGQAPSCDFAATPAETKALSAVLSQASRNVVASGSQLKTYRLALSNTPEYALTKGNTAIGVMAGKVATVNRVVGVYEKELAVRLVLVPNNDQLTFLSGGPAPPVPYSNANGSAMLGQNQSNVDQLIGTANYDIGHVVSTGGGGVAYLGVVCSTARKAGGVTGSPSPVGDAFDIDYVAHEMGHQFAGKHPFNGNAGSCAGGNRNASTAWEPGSGSSIMAYAGICGSANDLQPNSDPTFHTGNYEQMRAFINATACATITPTGNTAPVVTVPAGGKTLPISTPFKLTASATDAEGDGLTYSWEEMDLGSTGTPTTAQVANDNVPLFRSFNPTFSPTRYFPRLSNLVANTTVIGERLPTVTRSLKFRCTARDEHNGPLGIIGGVDFSAFVDLSVTSTAGPFVVTAPNTAMSWTGGAAQTVTWSVAGTDVAPVSCAFVNLRLSLDGGLTYPVVLALNEANDGSATIAVPNVPTSQARVMVESADNFFFDISNANFTIVPGTGPTITSFTPTGGLAGAVVVITGTNFTGATGVSFNGTAATTFTVNSATSITVTVPAGATTGPITVTAPTGVGTSVTPFVVGVPPTITSFTPTSGAVGNTVVITGTGFTGATLVTFNGTAATSFAVNSATQITVVVPGNANTGPISVTTPVSTVVSTGVFTVVSPPVISSFTPANGQPGTVVTLTGNYFTGATAVTFNGTAATTFTVNSATSITVTAPAGTTSGVICVTTPAGTGCSTNVFGVTPTNDLCANALPLTCGQSVTGTTVGSNATGDPTTTCSTVTIEGGGVFYSIVGTGGSITLSTCNAGTNFDTKLLVYSGACGVYTCVAANDDVTCTAAQYASTVTFPSTMGTTYRVFVTGYNGTTGSFVLTTTCATPPPPATITSLTPAIGPIGTGVQITGTNFTGATGVTFNGVAATSFFVIDAQTILATVPNGATTGNVVVTTGVGPSNGMLFTVTTPVPTLTSLSPTSGLVGTAVTITGTGLGGASSVTFNGTPAPGFTVTGSTTINVAVPAGATTGNVVVTTAGGASNGLPFTVIAVPVITGLSPAMGAVGTAVTLTGTGLTGTNSLSINGTVITGYTVVNATTITFILPAGATTGNVVAITAGGPTTNSAATLFTVTVGTATASANRSEFSVWPNPVAGKGTINVALATAAGTARVTLRNIVGQTVATRTFSGKTTELPTTGLASGTYLLTVQTDGRTPAVQRIVVE